MPLNKVSVVYKFTKVTQVTLIYEFGRFFLLIELEFFYCLIFSFVVKKIVFEKNHVIKLYKVEKIKGYEKTGIHPHILHCE